MQKIKLTETFDQVPSISLVEDAVTSRNNQNSRVDGKYIIGMIEGQFFKPDGMSRNQRWYGRKLWEKVLSNVDVRNRLAASTMFGEIGHSDGPVEDLTLRNGCASHFIDDLWIDKDGHGMGRAYILNTPTGNLLKTYLGAGCKLKVSTRGEGIYKEGEYHDGCPVIDEDSYELQTADFVLNPGFLETSANLKESYDKLNVDIVEQRKKIEETLAHVTRKGETNMTLDMDAYVQDLKEELKALKAENKSLNEQLRAQEKDLLQRQFEESAEIKKINEEFKPFKDMKVSAKTLTETLKRSQTALKEAEASKVKLEEELKGYKEKCGSLEQIDEATALSAKALKIIEAYRKIGSVKELTELKENAIKAVTKLTKYSRLGSVVDLQRLKENCEKLVRRKATVSSKDYKALKESAKKAAKVIEAYYKRYGSLNKGRKVITNEAVKFSKKYGCTVESAAKLLKKFGENKASKLMEAKMRSKKSIKVGLKEGRELIEKVAQLDKASTATETKTAEQYLTKGMLRSYFDNATHGKKIEGDINNIPSKANSAKELVAKYIGKFDVEKAPAVKDSVSSEAAERVANKLLK